MDGELLAIGILLGLLFSAVMVFKVLPPLDHIVKKNLGPVEACALTRCCPLLVGLPFYVFTIWMTVVIVVKSDKARSVIDQICPDDFGCTNDFALGRAQFDKSACLSADCSNDELFARAGVKPLHFPRLGLGEEVSPSTFTIDYSCVETEDDICVSVAFDDGTCGCSGELGENGFPLDCSSDSCLSDTEGNTRTSECTNDDCTEWSVDTDSRKQFTFQTCSCTNDDCSEFSCEVFQMQYLYPNIFYAGATTILFILPLVIGLYVVIKTQVRKVMPCGAKKTFVYNQEAGVQEHYVADNLATGGFNQEQKVDTKYRAFGKQDVFALITVPLAILFFSWQVVLVSGRVGLSFILLTPVSVVLVESFRLKKHLGKLADQQKQREEENNPDPFRAEF